MIKIEIKISEEISRVPLKVEGPYAGVSGLR
jgi:hypothetical protein